MYPRRSGLIKKINQLEPLYLINILRIYNI